MKYDVIVVGAGAAGAPLAARLSEDTSRRVLLLEAGPAPVTAAGFPAEVLDASRSTGLMPRQDIRWSFASRLTTDRTQAVTRGRILGGSTAINGGYFIRARHADLERWAAAGNTAWTPGEVLPYSRKIENDFLYGETELHGGSGPMPVYREVDHPAPMTRSFYEAAKELGFPKDADKNDPSTSQGYGPLPANLARGVRVNTGLAYLLPAAASRPNLTVRGEVFVHRVLFSGITAIGVAVEAGGSVEAIHAGEIILCAGAVKSPHLLALSGLGPADEVRKAGIDIVLDVPGVGKRFSDHPEVFVDFRAARVLDAGTNRFEGVLHWTANGSPAQGDLELLPMHRSIRPNGDLSLIVTVQQPDSRGDLTLVSADPHIQPRIEYHHLSEERDIERMREGIRIAARLLGTEAFRDGVDTVSSLDPATLDDDAALASWARAHLATAVHMCGTARMGTDASCVVDQFGRVRGVQGLRVADTSILPNVPSRGPAATAVTIGERVADFIVSGS